MSKAVLLSVRPEWCEKIASGEKTVEVRKTKPNLEPPFQVYIYCTGGPPYLNWHNGRCYIEERDTLGNRGCGLYQRLNKTIIGEFVCEWVHKFRVFEDGAVQDWLFADLEKSCLSYDEIAEYVGKDNYGYAWHISDLVIYETPKDFSEFIVPTSLGCCNEVRCRECRWFDHGNGFNIEDDCNAPFCTDEYKPLRRAPQSWCYIEKLEKE